jgi:3-phosphoshikimate 1-carboxyvinyltransferase
MTVRIVVPALVRGRVRAPPSKSYTHRAFVAAFLARGPCDVVRPLESEDTRATRAGLVALAARIRRTPTGWRVTPAGPNSPARRRTVRCGASGTTLRFLTAVAGLSNRSTTFTGSARLGARPMAELHRALKRLGATVQLPSGRRALPCTIQGPIHPGKLSIRGNESSQFTSALLMVLPTLPGVSSLTIVGPRVSRPYVEATCAVLEDRGIRVQRTSHGFRIPGDQSYRAGRIDVPGDASSAAYLWSAAAATGGDVVVAGISTRLPQADARILPLLAAMGARVQAGSEGIRVSGPVFRPISANLTDAPDLFPLVSVLAALVPGRRSTLSGAPHLEYKESDRRRASLRLARAMGAHIVAGSSRVEIIGAERVQPLTLTSLDDHRLVMCAAVAALAARGKSRIGRAEAVAKSYPGFWRDLDALTHAGRPAT